MSKSIVDLVDELPTDNITVKVLKAFDFVVPGGWSNLVGFDNTISAITGETQEKKINKIRDRALELYNDSNNGYQTAIWLYQTVDNTDQAVAAATLADKVGDSMKFIPFLANLTPKADTVQSVDFGLKLIVELIALSKINQITLNPSEFAKTVAENYRDEALMRMIGLVALDGLLPLGSNFVSIIHSKISSGQLSMIEENPAGQSVTELIPSSDKQGFINDTFTAVQGWAEKIASSVGGNSASVANKMASFVEVADDKLDYVAAFVDASVNYYEHTGIQTVARNLIKKAHLELE